MVSALPQAEPVRHVPLSPADAAQQTRRVGMCPGPGRPVTCERPWVCSCPSWKQREQPSCGPTAVCAALSSPFLAPRAPKLKGLVRRPRAPSSAGPCARALSALFSSHTPIAHRGSVGKESRRSQMGRLRPGSHSLHSQLRAVCFCKCRFPRGDRGVGKQGPGLSSF